MDDVKILEATGVSLDSKDEQGRTGIFQSCVELTLWKKNWGLVVVLLITVSERLMIEGRVC